VVIDRDRRGFATDKDGFLLDREAWHEGVAHAMAANDGHALTPAHWQIIHFLRDYYAQYRLIPPMRLLIKAVEKRFGPDIGNSRYLYRLFPDGPVKQGSRYAGLPKPPHCI
jgi:TusE/DsrC/DsvC family sulfur relay protein